MSANIVTMTNGIQINIPLIEYSNMHLIGVSENFYHYANGEPLATILGLEGYARQCDTKGPLGSSSTCYAIGQWFRSPYRTAEDYATGGTGKYYQDLIDQYGVWLWGSWQEGGVFMYKITSGRYCIGSFTGVWREGDYYCYWVNMNVTDNWSGLSLNECSKCTFISREYVDGDKDLRLMYQRDGYAFNTYRYGSTIVSVVEHNQTINAAMSASNWIKPITAGVTVDSQELPYQAWKLANTDGSPTSLDCIIGIGRNAATPSIPSGYSKAGGSIWGGSVSDPSNPNSNGGTTNPAGGDGPWDDNTDNVGDAPDDQFTVDVINTGLFTLYKPTKGQIDDLADFLFTDITDSMSTQLKKLCANPLDYVVFLAMCHFDPTATTNKNITYAGFDTGVVAPVIDQQIFRLDCGYINLFDSRTHKEDTASFLSYSPYYKAMIYLPYIGMQQLNVDDIMRGTVHLRYTIDLLTGSCVANIMVRRDKREAYSDIAVCMRDEQLIASYSGNVYQNIPLSATDWRGLFSSVISFAGGAIATATGSAAGLGAMASAVIAEKVAPSRSGQLGANYGYMCQQKPFLLLERPVLNQPDEYGAWEGYTSNMYERLGDLHGYTEIDPGTLWTDNMDGITEDEAEMLRSITSSGFCL